MAFRMIGSIVLLLAVFGLVVSSLGFLVFSNAIVREYTNSTYRMADMAAALVRGEHVEAYLAGGETAEYEQTREMMNSYCRYMNVSLIYVKYTFFRHKYIRTLNFFVSFVLLSKKSLTLHIQSNG